MFNAVPSIRTQSIVPAYRRIGYANTVTPCGFHIEVFSSFLRSEMFKGYHFMAPYGRSNVRQVSGPTQTPARKEPSRNNIFCGLYFNGCDCGINLSNLLGSCICGISLEYFLPKVSEKKGSIVSRTRGSTGVVACVCNLHNLQRLLPHMQHFRRPLNIPILPNLPFPLNPFILHNLLNLLLCWRMC